MKRKVLKILILIIILLIITNISYAKFITRINGKGLTKVKVPILVLENNEVITGEISKKNNSYYQDFSLKNYLESTKQINEINFEYTIKLFLSTTNFPVNYQLINLDTNQEILFNENFETGKIQIGTDKIMHRYRLIVNWSENYNNEIVDENVDVKIKINANQV